MVIGTSIGDTAHTDKEPTLTLPKQTHWDILLLGGNSAAGKTTLAESLARRYEARYIDLDLFWIVLKRAVPAHVQPDLHLYDDDAVWEREPEQLAEWYVRVAMAVCNAVEPLVAHHRNIRRPVVMEGCWILPEFATQRVFAGENVGNSVRSLFLVETDPGAIESRLRSRREGWLESHSAQAQHNLVETQWRFGQEVRRRAQALGLPVLPPAPFETLEERAIRALEAASGA